MATEIHIDQQCSNCHFYEHYQNYTYRGQMTSRGKCHRYPPQIVSSSPEDYSDFPLVNEKEYCGEFQQRELKEGDHVAVDNM